MKYLCFILTLFFSSQALLANGWVKDKGQYYAKIGYSQTSERDFRAAPGSFSEKESAASLYGELGLGLPWTSQVTIYTAYKTIERDGLAAGIGSYTAASHTDTKLNLKSRLFSLNQVGTLPVSIFAALTTGVNLPTTPDEYSLGSDERLGDVPAGAPWLVGPVDKGETGSILGLGLSAYYGGVWANAGYTDERETGGDWQDGKWEFALGVGLPGNSWIQAGYSRLRSTFTSGDAGDADTANETTEERGISLGLTVWQGLALEGGYLLSQKIDSPWEDWAGYTVGVSHRTL